MKVGASGTAKTFRGDLEHPGYEPDGRAMDDLVGSGQQPAYELSFPTAWRVASSQSVEYRVKLTSHIFDPENGDFEAACGFENGSSRRRLIVIDQEVFNHFGAALTGYCQVRNIKAVLTILRTSEEVKTTETLKKVLQSMVEFGVARRCEPVIAIGGGVLMDVVGFAASIYRRGVPYVRIPTTLIGLVDAGIGIKTGANFENHKNRLGTYFPPSIAILDRSFLRSLGVRDIANGLAEIIKIALVKDASLLALLEKYADQILASRFQGAAAHDAVVCKAIIGMLEELEPNLWESKLERLVDYGHTFSPVLEIRALPSLLHGEAVAIDMAICLALSQGRGLMSAVDVSRALRLIHRCQLPLTHHLCTLPLLVEALADATRHRDNQQRQPLTTGIGHARFVNDISIVELERALSYISRIATELRD